MERDQKLIGLLTEKSEFPLLPLRDIIVFPGMLAPLFVGREKSIRAVNHAIEENDNLLLLSAQKSASTEDPDQEDIYSVGCICEVIQVFRMPDGTVKIMVEGVARAPVHNYVSTEPFFMVNTRAEIPLKRKEPSPEWEALSRTVKGLFERYAKLESRMQPEDTMAVTEVNEAEELSNAIMGHLGIPTPQRQSVLEENNPYKRLEMIIDFLEKEIEILQIEKKVKGRVKKQMDQSQREYYLHEQMKAIQKELGRSDARSDMDEIRENLLKADMPKEVETKALKELNKLEQMPPMSAEGTVVRNYLDWLSDLPWKKRSKDNLDTVHAKNVLDEDHHGLNDVKERILEYLAVRKLSKTGRSPILCLVGPPGVGKTSLGKSIARATGREFVRLSLGGVRDEAEIRGHRRTYIGSMPGRLIQSMKKAGTVNPVMMLDEIDKMTSDFRGDPSSALLEALDPEQNKNFSDHYLEVDYDLSQVMFITTANVLHTIPGPLLDRMEVIELAGYTEYEKVKIAKNFLIPKILKEHGLEKENLTFTDAAVKQLIHYYTREAGVRSLERELSSVCRKIAKKVVERKKFNRKVSATTVKQLLGPEKYRQSKAEAHSETGLAVGLAWTQVGGDMMHIEVTVVPGKGKLILTGKLGEVMRESAQAALSYIRSRSDRFGLKRDFYQQNDIHIHVPEGAIPKDGPSAGITMVSAMASAFCKTPVRHDVAMTGEVTLRGKVLPIGGLKQKALAAHRAGIKEVVFPADNERDLEKLPANVLKEITFTPVKDMDQVLDVVMTEPVFKDRTRKVRTKKKPAEDMGNQPGIN